MTPEEAIKQIVSATKVLRQAGYPDFDDIHTVAGCAVKSEDQAEFDAAQRLFTWLQQVSFVIGAPEGKL